MSNHVEFDSQRRGKCGLCGLSAATAGPPRTSVIRGAGVLAWLAVVVAGMLALIDYSSAPGTVAGVCDDWPAGSAIEHEERGATLVMFVHPRCPCTRASVRELARLLANASSAVSVRTVFFCPGDKPESWVQSDLWRSAAELSPTPPIVDRDGREASRFGATTSGQVLLFAANGERLFSGGITTGRGHEGDNAGRDAVHRLINGKSTGRTECPVYGCSLFSDGV